MGDSNSKNVGCLRTMSFAVRQSHFISPSVKFTILDLELMKKLLINDYFLTESNFSIILSTLKFSFDSITQIYLLYFI